jgi:phosphatidate phosphatase APP1
MANWNEIFQQVITTAVQGKELIKQVAVAAEDGIEAVKHKVQDTLDKFSDVQVVVYRGFGSDKKAYIKGRVLKSKKVTLPTEQDSTLINMFNMYKRFESDAIAQAVVEVKFQGVPNIVISDAEGYFELEVEPQNPLNILPRTENFEVRLQSSPIGQFEAGELQETGKILVPPKNADFGIISDIDDTIIETSATDIVKMLANTFTKNALTRVPFSGVRSFYRALQQGKEGNNHNPMFYVSSSPWNLYDFLGHLIDIHDLPEGVFCLRDYGADKSKANLSAHGEHKITEISRIMETYPNLSFILIGDSGQQDAPSYKKIAEMYPNRILAIYIRDVKDHSRRMFVNEIFKDFYGSSSTQVVLMQETIDAARHAVMNGWILPTILDTIEK